LKKPRNKNLIGRREHIDFPDLGLFNITAKIDTGAYTSALHCHDIREIGGVLHFRLLSDVHPEFSGEDHSTSDFILKEIRNSFGESETRYIIKTRVKIGQRTIKSLISLTNRGTMRYPVLIGRRMLKNRFVVDVSQLNIAAANLTTDY
jgi:hypothetical protein